MLNSEKLYEIAQQKILLNKSKNSFIKTAENLYSATQLSKTSWVANTLYLLNTDSKGIENIFSNEDVNEYNSKTIIDLFPNNVEDPMVKNVLYNIMSVSKKLISNNNDIKNSLLPTKSNLNFIKILYTLLLFYQSNNKNVMLNPIDITKKNEEFLNGHGKLMDTTKQERASDIRIQSSISEGDVGANILNIVYPTVSLILNVIFKKQNINLNIFDMMKMGTSLLTSLGLEDNKVVSAFNKLTQNGFDVTFEQKLNYGWDELKTKYGNQDIDKLIDEHIENIKNKAAELFYGLIDTLIPLFVSEDSKSENPIISVFTTDKNEIIKLIKTIVETFIRQNTEILRGIYKFQQNKLRSLYVNALSSVLKGNNDFISNLNYITSQNIQNSDVKKINKNNNILIEDNLFNKLLEKTKTVNNYIQSMFGSFISWSSNENNNNYIEQVNNGLTYVFRYFESIKSSVLTDKIIDINKYVMFYLNLFNLLVIIIKLSQIGFFALDSEKGIQENENIYKMAKRGLDFLKNLFLNYFDSILPGKSSGVVKDIYTKFAEPLLTQIDIDVEPDESKFLISKITEEKKQYQSIYQSLTLSIKGKDDDKQKDYVQQIVNAYDKQITKEEAIEILDNLVLYLQKKVTSEQIKQIIPNIAITKEKALFNLAAVSDPIVKDLIKIEEEALGVDPNQNQKNNYELFARMAPAYMAENKRQLDTIFINPRKENLSIILAISYLLSLVDDANFYPYFQIIKDMSYGNNELNLIDMESIYKAYLFLSDKKNQNLIEKINNNYNDIENIGIFDINDSLIKTKELLLGNDSAKNLFYDLLNSLKDFESKETKLLEPNTLIQTNSSFYKDTIDKNDQEVLNKLLEYADKKSFGEILPSDIRPDFLYKIFYIIEKFKINLKIIIDNNNKLSNAIYLNAERAAIVDYFNKIVLRDYIINEDEKVVTSDMYSSPDMIATLNIINAYKINYKASKDFNNKKLIKANIGKQAYIWKIEDKEDIINIQKIIKSINKDVKIKSMDNYIAIFLDQGNIFESAIFKDIEEYYINYNKQINIMETFNRFKLDALKKIFG